MKRKGITFWEQHVERIVLGAAVLFFVAFTVLQFLKEPNAVDDPPGGRVSPEEVDALLEEKAETLETRLEPTAPATIDIPDPESRIETFKTALAASISPVDRLVPPDRRIVIADDFTVQQDVEYAVPSLPAPTSVVSDQFFDAVEDELVATVPALAERLPERPYDLSWVTVAALFDLDAVRDALRREGPDGQPAVPPNWYYSRIHVLDVKLERETYRDGRWTDRVTLDPIPGQVTLRPTLTGPMSKTIRDTVIAALEDPAYQRSIYQPEFYLTKNDGFRPIDPRIDESLSAGMTAEEEDIMRLILKIRRFRAERDRQLAQLTELGGSMDDPGRDETEQSGGRSGRGDDQGGGGGRRPTQPPKRPGGAGAGTSIGQGEESGPNVGGRAEDNERMINRLRQKVRISNRRIDIAERDLAELQGGELNLDLDSDSAAELPSDVTGGELVVWAHDITVKPDEAYRYRMAIDLYNPFFGHKLELLAEQQPLSEQIVITTPASDWSAPREVIPPLKVFVTKAWAADDRTTRGLGLGRASAEVYRFHDGRWWLEQFPVEPGDRIGAEERVGRRGADAEERRIDFGTEWFVLDIIEDIDASTLDEETGYAARVVLQHRLDPGVTQTVDPRAEARDLERERLKDAVELADLPDEVAVR